MPEKHLFEVEPPQKEKKENLPEDFGNFHRKELCILTHGYGSFDIGIQRLYNDHVARNLKLVTIKDFPAKPGTKDIGGIFDNIIESLPDDHLNFKIFKETVEETVKILFESNVKLEFPDERYIRFAIACVKDDSYDPLEGEDKDVIKKVEDIFRSYG